MYLKKGQTHLKTVYIQTIKLSFISFRQDVTLLHFCEMLLKVAFHLSKAKG